MTDLSELKQHHIEPNGITATRIVMSELPAEFTARLFLAAWYLTDMANTGELYDPDSEAFETAISGITDLVGEARRRFERSAQIDLTEVAQMLALKSSSCNSHDIGATPSPERLAIDQALSDQIDADLDEMDKRANRQQAPIPRYTVDLLLAAKKMLVPPFNTHPGFLEQLSDAVRAFESAMPMVGGTVVTTEING